MNILLLGSQHGDELLGDALYAYIKKHEPELMRHVTFRIANPKAHEAHIRYLESDMNRSYDHSDSTYESKLAADLLDYINQESFDLVLDLHTTRSVQEPCIIIKDRRSENERFIHATSIGHIVLMQDDIVRSSLIGNVPQAISIEVADTDIDNRLLEEIASDIKRYIRAQRLVKRRNFYKVTGLLYKSEISEKEAEKLINFKKSPHGFYPVLVGENSYKEKTSYLGFKAEKVRYNEDND